MRLPLPWGGRGNPTPQPHDAPSGGSGPAFYGEILTHEQVSALAAELVDHAREHIVVGVTSIPHEHVPSIDVETLRVILPIGTRVYFIPSGSLTFRLMSLLPDRRAPYNGAARIWIPGGDWESDRFRHPQVYDETNEYGFRAIREIAYKLRHALAKSGLFVGFDPVEAYRDLELARAHADLENVQRALARTVSERDLAVGRLRASESRERAAEHELTTLRTRVLGPLALEPSPDRPAVDQTSQLSVTSRTAQES